MASVEKLQKLYHIQVQILIFDRRLHAVLQFLLIPMIEIRHYAVGNIYRNVLSCLPMC